MTCFEIESSFYPLFVLSNCTSTLHIILLFFLLLMITPTTPHRYWWVTAWKCLPGCGELEKAWAASRRKKVLTLSWLGEEWQGGGGFQSPLLLLYSFLCLLFFLLCFFPCYFAGLDFILVALGLSRLFFLSWERKQISPVTTEPNAVYVSVVLKEEQLAGCVEDHWREKALEKKEVSSVRGTAS